MEFKVHSKPSKQLSFHFEKNILSCQFSLINPYNYDFEFKISSNCSNLFSIITGKSSIVKSKHKLDIFIKSKNKIDTEDIGEWWNKLEPKPAFKIEIKDSSPEKNTAIQVIHSALELSVPIASNNETTTTTTTSESATATPATITTAATVDSSVLPTPKPNATHSVSKFEFLLQYVPFVFGCILLFLVTISTQQQLGRTFDFEIMKLIFIAYLLGLGVCYVQMKMIYKTKKNVKFT